MQSKGIIAVVVLVLVAIGTYFYSQTPQDSESEGSEFSQALLSHIPSDTLAYFVTETSLPIEAYSSSDASLAQAMQTMQLLAASTKSPAGKFGADLAYRYLRSAQAGAAELQQDWGFGETLESAFYFIGLAPVFEFSMSSPAIAVAQIRSAAEAQGLSLETERLTGANSEGVQQHRVVILDSDEKRLSLIIRERADSLRLTLDGPFDEALSALVRGETLPERSLANTEGIDKVRSSVNLQADVIGVVNFLEMTKGLTTSTSNMAQMINVFMGGENPLAELQTPACQTELSAWVSGVPEWIIATDIDYQAAAKLRTMQSESLLRISNPEIAAQLQSLNGVLPNYDAVKDFAPIYSFALGLNLSQLTPVVMDLHQRLVSATFTCSYLASLQAKASQQSPAMLGMATAMVAGLKGFSMSVHDLELTEAGMGVKQASALVSVSASSIRQLLSMAQSMLGMTNLDIPEDGSAVALESALIPAAVPALKIAIKDEKHAVIYTEDAKAQALADSFSGLSLESSGFIDMRFDASTFFGEEGGLWKQVSTTAAAMTQMNAEACITAAVLKSSYEGAEMKLNVDLSFADKGLKSKGKVWQTLIDPESLRVSPGEYDGAMVGEACVAEIDGLETINSDGTGLSQLRDYESTCPGFDYETEYQWQQHGRSLEFTFTRERERSIENCDTPWSDWTPVEAEYVNESCIVIEKTEQGFSCVFGGEGEPFMVEFTQKAAN